MSTLIQILRQTEAIALDVVSALPGNGLLEQWLTYKLVVAANQILVIIVNTVS